MQTRRDQLQAYRFQNRRALAALVTGQPNVLEPPMRRLTVTTLSGIMIAILIAIVFGIIAIIRPSAGDSWRTNGAVVIDQDNNSTYVYLKDRLYPTLNYTSAVLAASGTNTVSHVKVSSGDIAGAHYGAEIGIPDAPSSLPAASSLVGFPISVCSKQGLTKGGTPAARVTVYVHRAFGGNPLASSRGVVVAAADTPDLYLLNQGRRLPLSRNTASALGLSDPPVVVGTAFLDSVPLGPTLAPPTLPRTGMSSTHTVAGRHLAVGSVVQTTDATSTQTYVVLDQGLVHLSPLEADLYSGVRPIRVSPEDATNADVAPGQNAITEAFTGLPSTPPHNDAAALLRGGVCAVYHQGSASPAFTLPTHPLSSPVDATVIDSRTSRSGRADKVDVPATKGVLATPANDPHTLMIISDQGIRYSFASSSLLAGFGYRASDAIKVPPQVIALIPHGSGLSSGAARQTVVH